MSLIRDVMAGLAITLGSPAQLVVKLPGMPRGAFTCGWNDTNRYGLQRCIGQQSPPEAFSRKL